MSNDKTRPEMSLTDIAIFYYLYALLSTNYCVCGDFSSKEKSDYRPEEKFLRENERREYAYGDRTYENFPSAVIQEYKNFQSELGRNLFAKFDAKAENQKADDALMPETKIRYETDEPKGSEAIDVDKIIEELDNAKAAAEKSMPYMLEKPSLDVNKNKRMLKQRWIPFYSHKNSKNKSSKSKTESQSRTPCIDCHQKTGNELILNEQTKAEPDYNVKPNSKSETQGPFNYFKMNKRSDYPCQCPSCRNKLATATNTDISYLMKESDPSKVLISSTPKTTMSFDLDYIPNTFPADSKNLKAGEFDAFIELEQKIPALSFGDIHKESGKRRFDNGKGNQRKRSVSLNEADSANERRLKMLDEIQRKIDNVQIPQATEETLTTEINIV